MYHLHYVFDSQGRFIAEYFFHLSAQRHADEIGGSTLAVPVTEAELTNLEKELRYV